jgi:predicted ATPase/DNA-binding CsgD family transcriptional regulator/DNA-binding XRE family transcriptional regulator
VTSQVNGRGPALQAEDVLLPTELRARRQALGLTQAGLAALLRVTSTTVARWERNEQRIGNPERVRAALARLEISAPGNRVVTDSSPEWPRHNLPAELSSFVGREKDVVYVKDLLAGTRLLTLTGAGGIGKTRVALRVGAACLRDYPDGVWLVELAPLTDPGLVARAVATVLGVREKARHALLDTLAEALLYRHVLLLFDNCEHLVEACAELAHALLSRCPMLRILATSREALSVPGEAAWQLPPLGLPAEGGFSHAAELAQSGSGQLFIERARAALPAFASTEQNAGPIAEICHRLDGVPLALELAAARVSVLGIGQIAARLGDRFPVLTGNRTAPRRHQTLRAAFDWSYDLLSDGEQRLFDRLSVFAGGWTLEAGEAVAGELGDEAAPGLLDLLTQLVAKSLVVAEPRPNGQVRYRLLEPLRQYGRDHLERSGEAGATQAQHGEYFLRLAEQAKSDLHGPALTAWLDQVDMEHDNLRSALRTYLEDGDVESAERLGGTLWLFWQPRGYLEEGWNWLTRILAQPGGKAVTPMRARVLQGAGMLAHHRGDYHASKSLSEESLALSRALGDMGQVSWLLAHLALLARLHYEYPQARALCGEGLGVARAAGTRLQEAEILANLGRLEYLEGDLEAAYVALDNALRIYSDIGGSGGGYDGPYGHGLIQVLRFVGEVAYRRGDYRMARFHIERSLARAREFGDPWRIAFAAGPLGYVLVAQGEYELARAIWIQCLLAWREIGNINHVGGNLEGLGFLAARQGHLERALRLAGAATSIRRASDVMMPPDARMWLDDWLPAARSRLGEPGATTAWAEGEAMSVHAAIACALDEQPVTPDQLTPREREVATLISLGFTDRKIAQALIISGHTAHTHVRNILGKLGLQSRVQIAAWAVQKGVSEVRVRSLTENT